MAERSILMADNVQAQIHKEMEVFGSDMLPLGTVEDVRQGDFLLDRPSDSNVYVPFSTVQEVKGKQVILNILAAEVNIMSWRSPSLGEPT
jgi:hypothetical protein